MASLCLSVCVNIEHTHTHSDTLQRDLVSTLLWFFLQSVFSLAGIQQVLSTSIREMCENTFGTDDL